MISTRILKEITKEWQDIMELADKIPHGQIVLRVNEKKVTLVEYTVQKKPTDSNDFEVKGL
jgi:hypothetical protein